MLSSHITDTQRTLVAMILVIIAGFCRSFAFFPPARHHCLLSSSLSRFLSLVVMIVLLVLSPVVVPLLFTFPFLSISSFLTLFLLLLLLLFVLFLHLLFPSSLPSFSSSFTLLSSCCGVLVVLLDSRDADDGNLSIRPCCWRCKAASMMSFVLAVVWRKSGHALGSIVACNHSSRVCKQNCLSREKLNPPPLAPLWSEGIFQGEGGGGLCISKPPAGRNFIPPLFYTPPQRLSPMACHAQR